MLPDAVIFDMDGVIVDTADAHCASWQMLAAEQGVTISRHDFLQTFGRPTREIIRTRFGEHLTDEQVGQMDRRKEAHFRELAQDHVKLIPHVVELIEALIAAGVALAVGSSAPPANVQLTLDQFDLNGRFRTLVTGHDVTRGKPDPEVFLIAADRLGVSPSRCVVIEDAMAGIQAARAAGMTAIALTTSHERNAFPHAHRVVDSLAELQPEALLAGEA